ncbi:DUF1992 domain-containing protein [Wenxinia marina]|uniref:DnaJ homologue subfamily C member 28 conserved domain-containing protein n=1 Tax=Wenxinia marina DSM 24838 TaxID=1123501 RepID=A0A0D0Q741_9RHOB|nr:DUF1992 domain-containing protein [Wenxinia marina]KIQ68267.1 hypothetical protein Wenmar_03105 [Wenxinia marina DSM 24838]GGL79262.1 hypothetical protein GCM10011392_37170 [Wenxinia marina]
MTRAINELVERQIRKAEAGGQFRNLPGAGKPLPERPGQGAGDIVEEVGFRIMAEAGVLPPEIAIRKEIAAHKDHMAIPPSARPRWPGWRSWSCGTRSPWTPAASSCVADLASATGPGPAGPDPAGSA